MLCLVYKTDDKSKKLRLTEGKACEKKGVLVMGCFLNDKGKLDQIKISFICTIFLHNNSCPVIVHI